MRMIHVILKYGNILDPSVCSILLLSNYLLNNLNMEYLKIKPCTLHSLISR